MKTVTTPKGTALPLVNLKGKDYLQVAHRLQWFNEAAEKFHIDTDFLLCNADETVARAKVTVFDKDGKEVKHATATKRETKKDFPDHTEKAETGAIGRALALLGYGTQFALSDLDEGSRLADAPVVNAKAPVKQFAEAPKKPTAAEAGAGGPPPAIIATNPAPEVKMEAPKISTFRKNKPAPEQRTHTQAADTVAGADDGWT